MAHKLRKESLLVDAVPSVLLSFDLNRISKKFNLSGDMFELIKCHKDFRANDSFEEGDQIVVYEE